MAKHIHEFRDPIHNFIHVTTEERKVIDSLAFQRLRHIHQLATTYLIYPSATHKRFEHSLGVMELAGRVFDIVTDEESIRHELVREFIPHRSEREGWKRIVRISALLHDIGHLPFSHAAEKELLPKDYSHERLTIELIERSELTKILESLRLTPKLIAKIAVGPKEYKTESFNIWETLLSEIIVGNSFGVDRIDYLLRDSHHVGVAYGKFDHYRLLETIRILPKGEGDATEKSTEPVIGIEEGGINVAESLLLARYLMFSQVYFHPVRRAYDTHLKDFLLNWLPDGKFPIEPDSHIRMTDNEVNAGVLSSYYDSKSKAHKEAKRMIERDHFKLFYSSNQFYLQKNPRVTDIVFEKAKEVFGEERIRRDKYPPKKAADIFPVYLREGRIIPSIERSSTLSQIPIANFDYLFVEPNQIKKANEWLKDELRNILKT
jgi:HD superfamily phosphohydrolase